MSVVVFLLNSCRRNSNNAVEPPTPVYLQIDDGPAWSPDGGTIAYYHSHVTKIWKNGACSVNRDSTGIWFIDTAGSNYQMFLNLKEWSAGSPDWSPDGNKLAFVRGAHIYTINVDGSGLTCLTCDEEGRFFFPDWSADGKKIAYDCTTEPPGRGIWVMEAGGENKRYLIPFWRSPDWSPDGAKFVCEGGLGSTGAGSQIWVIDTTGTNAKQLTFLGIRNIDPVWSPDGAKIVFFITSKWRSPSSLGNGFRWKRS